MLPFEVWELWPDLNLIILKPISWLEGRSEEGGGRKISMQETTAEYCSTVT